MTRPPRLLHLATTAMSHELLLGPQLSAFHDLGFEVHAAAAPTPIVPAIEARGVTFHPMKHSTRSMSLLDDLRAATEFWRLCRRIRPDIVHTHNPKPGVYGRIMARLAGVRGVVNTVHGLYAQPTDPWLKRAAVYGLERVAAVASDMELVQNEEDVATLTRTLKIPPDRVTLLGNGIDLDRFGPPRRSQRIEMRRSLGFNDGDVVIGAVGRLVAEKGYLELFDAFARVRAGHPETKLLVVGPHDRAKGDVLTHEAISQAEAQGVQFLGHRLDVDELYGALDIYVLASHREGFPRSAMEAAATGLPVLATDIRGCRQVVDHGDNGLLVPAKSPAELAAAMSKLVSDADLRQRMGQAGLAKAAAAFDQRNVITITLAAYAPLIDQDRLITTLQSEPAITP